MTMRVMHAYATFCGKVVEQGHTCFDRETREKIAKTPGNCTKITKNQKQTMHLQRNATSISAIALLPGAQKRKFDLQKNWEDDGADMPVTELPMT